MKNPIAIAICAVLIVIASSCSSTHKILVSGAPNTQIYTPSGAQIAIIDHSGKAEIDVTADAYYAYLLSKAPSSNLYVPFALDYKKCSYNGAKASRAGGMFLATVGALGAIAGTVAVAIDSEDSSAPILMGAGCGSVLLGTSFGAPASSRLEQLSYQYQFKYTRDQKVNSDMLFSNPTIEYITANESLETASDAQHADNEDGIIASLVVGKKVSSHSTKTLKDYGSKLAGEYIGYGSLKLGNEVIEKYSDITVLMKRVSDNAVNVNVIENNTPFFKYPLIYNIEKTGNGYFLVCKDIKTATINIDKNGKMEFLHPRINIDGDIYSLSIKSAGK